MTVETLRILGAFAVAVVMAIMAAFTREQPYRRASLGLGALALLLLAAFNAGTQYGFNGLPFAWIALALLIVALGCYIMSWVKGEVLKRHAQMRLKMIEDVKRRREALKKTPPAQE